jgi:hypothetical protein
VPTLPTKALHFRNGHPYQASGLKGGFHILETERLDNGFYLFHGFF